MLIDQRLRVFRVHFVDGDRTRKFTLRSESRDYLPSSSCAQFKIQLPVMLVRFGMFTCSGINFFAGQKFFRRDARVEMSTSIGARCEASRQIRRRHQIQIQFA